MHKYEVLRHCAEEFRLALEKYAKEDVKHKSELEWFIQQWMPWYEKIKHRDVRLPCYEYKLDKYFTNPDLSNMAETYHYTNPNHPLNKAAGDFYCAIMDRYSDQKFVAQLKEKFESLDLIPDEPPPPEEETPLPAVEETRKRPGHGWLYRWIFGERKR